MNSSLLVGTPALKPPCTNQENAQQSAAHDEQDDCASVSQDDFSTAESENSENESDHQAQSELSAESPELHVRLEKENTKSTKRKQKSHKKLSKNK